MNLTFLDFIAPFADDLEPGILRAINEVGMDSRCTACIHGFPRQDRQRECLLKLETERHKGCEAFEPFMRVALDEFKAIINDTWHGVAAHIASHFPGMDPRRPVKTIEQWRRGRTVPGYFYKAALVAELAKVFGDYAKRKEAVLDDMQKLRQIGKI